MGTGRKYILITCETRLEQRGRFLHDPFMHSMYEDVAVPVVRSQIRPDHGWRGGRAWLRKTVKTAAFRPYCKDGGSSIFVGFPHGLL